MGRKRSAKKRGFPDNLYQNPDGYFYYRNHESGKRKGIGYDKAKAFREARAANAVLANKTESRLAVWVSGIEQLSLKDWVPVYKEKWIKDSKPAASTLRNQSGYLERIADASFAWMSLKDITTVHVSGFLEKIEEESGAPTARMVRSRLSDVFRVAETKGQIETGRNPVAATDKADYEVKRERLSLEQFWEIHKHAKLWVQRAMVLALLTAQRREDITNMKFTDVQDGFLYVIQRKSRGKMRLQQDLNIRLEAAGMTVGDAIKNCRDRVVSAFMIHHTYSAGSAKVGDGVDENSLSNRFQEARDAAGIVAAEGRTPPSFHEIRSLSERLYKKEYGAEFAQAMLGHKNAKTTATYDDLRGSGWQVVAAKG